MSATVNDLMTRRVVTARPHHSIEHIRKLMDDHHCGAIPVLGPDSEPIGIISAMDLVHAHLKGGAPVSGVMNKNVYTVPRYEGPHIAARIMRNHKIHHLVVTDEGELVGMLSAFDLLELVEDHRFAMRQPPTIGRHSNRRGVIWSANGTSHRHRG
jgi:CBS domain-containing protein